MTDTGNTALEKLCPSPSDQRIIYFAVEIRTGQLQNYWRFKDTSETISFPFIRFKYTIVNYLI